MSTQNGLILLCVALFTRAWIEIMLSTPALTACSHVALFTRAWIEMVITPINLIVIPGRPLHEGVD